MRCRHELENSLHTGGTECLPIVFEHGFERLLRAPLRVLGGERLHPVECERELDVERLLAPERAVVVEDRDPLRGGT